MEGDLIHINEWLKPLSWLYGFGVRCRNLLFDTKVLKEQAFDHPVICIGNITVGGTGKTPHTEYLLRLLLPHHRVAVLSRGYKRKSRGFHLADANTPMEVIGDEPWQITGPAARHALPYGPDRGLHKARAAGKYGSCADPSRVRRQYHGADHHNAHAAAVRDRAL